MSATERIELQRHGSSTPKSKVKNPLETTRFSLLVQDYGDLLENHELSDVRLLCGAKRTPIFAHRAVLAARCAFFRRLFTNILHSKQTSSDSAGTAPQQQTWDATAEPRLSHIGDTPFITTTSDNLVEVPLDQTLGKPMVHSWGPGSPDVMSDVPILRPPAQEPVTSASKATLAPRPTYSYTTSPLEPVPKKASISEIPQLQEPLLTTTALSDDSILHVELPNISYETLSPIIKYLYTLALDITAKNIVSVYSLAFEMGLSSFGPELLNALPALTTDETVVDLLLEAHKTPYCQTLLEALFEHIKANPKQARFLINSPRIRSLPLSLVYQMMALQLFPDEYEVYEKFVEARLESGASLAAGGEVEQTVQKLCFARMSAEQLVRVQKAKKVPDSIILDALKAKVQEGLLTERVAGGSCVILEIVVFGESPNRRLAAAGRHGPFRLSAAVPPRDPSPESSSRDVVATALATGHATTSHSPVSGVSPASLLRRRSISHPAGIDPDRLPAIGSDNFHSETFQLHGGEWTVVVKTRGGLLYKIGLVLKHVCNECDGVSLSSFSIYLENLTRGSTPHQFDFPTTVFTTGKEAFQAVDVATSGVLGFSTSPHPFKRTPRSVLQVRVQFPVLSKISYLVDE